MEFRGMKRLGAVMLFGGLTCPLMAQVRITEFMYQGANGEFVEFTNRGAAPVDMTGWSFDDDSNVPGSLDLSLFGMVAPGESVIVTDALTDVAFRTAWSLPITVKVVAGSTQGLARNDQINLYDNNGILVTRLTYGDQNFPGTIRTQNRSGWPCAEVLGQQTISLSWILSVVADAQASFTSVGGDIGSPGGYIHSFCGPPPTGACCEDGACSGPLTEADCNASGGVYQGDGSDCGSTMCPVPTGGAIRITEYMYSGNGGEYIEFTNMDNHPIDMAGWSYDDDSNTPGTTNLSAFGVVNPGESVILTEDTAADFITEWGLVGVDVIGNNVSNLSRNDQINLYDSGGALVDRLDYGDQTFPGTIRTQFFSGWPCAGAVGMNDITRWFLSSMGDVQNSYASSNTDVGNPGTFVVITCPVCGNDVVEVGEDCDGGDCCTQTCDFASSSTVCRAAAGSCDVAETCTGADADCPADGIASIDVVCRPSAGDCDSAENCDGMSADCPADGFSSANICRPAASLCDVPEACDGMSAACPADGFASADVVCRISAGICDVAENCTGSSSLCPADGFTSGNVCRPTADVCDAAEICSGLSADCPADGFAPVDVACRTSAGICDVAENCTGLSAACPNDGFSSGNMCRPSADVCDVAESCSGTSADCPVDGFATAAVSCRPSAGVCDVAENCTGSGVACPSNGFVAGGTTCRNANGVCDVAEACTGTSADCPGDAFDLGSVCRPEAGICDMAESCSGTSPDCPTDAYLGGTECRPSTGDCDPAEDCTGAEANCPPDLINTTCGLDDGCCPSSDCYSDADGDPDCPSSAIPTVSEWGLIILALLLLAGSKLRQDRRAGMAV